ALPMQEFVYHSNGLTSERRNEDDYEFDGEYNGDDGSYDVFWGGEDNGDVEEDESDVEGGEDEEDGSDVQGG
ncbi:hypothetical protein A2U01_0087913, partial [Trifolium medium]|nr:hypothetical protein [Trifolium medium]